MTTDNHTFLQAEAPELAEKERPNKGLTWGIRQKATLFGVLLGTLPVLGIGAIAYNLANESINKQISELTTQRTVGSQQNLTRFMADRFADINWLSDLPVFVIPKFREIATMEEKEKILAKVIKSYKYYDSIAAFDLNGNVFAQSKGENLPNHKNVPYFQETLKTGKYSFTNVQTVDGKKVIYLVGPYRNGTDGPILGVVRARMPLQNIPPEILGVDSNSVDGSKLLSAKDDIYVTSPQGEIIVSSSQDNIGKDAGANLPRFDRFKNSSQVSSAIGINKLDNEEQLITYVPPQTVSGVPPLGWSVLGSVSTQKAFLPQRQLLTTLALGTLLAAVAAGALAAYLTNRATRPLIESSDAVKKLGQGELDTRIAVEGSDELAELGSNINSMADQIQTLLAQQEESARKEIAIQAEIAAEQKKRNEQLQEELFKLLTDVEGASQGNLTVRAQITAGEIGIVADFFNTIVENLRDLVTQVQQSATQVNSSVGENESAIRKLTDEALKQAAQIHETVDSVEAMTQSIQQVADNARTTAQVARQASEVAQSGGETMDKTVNSILQLRETVAETGKKVKRLGEASQQISKVISLINEIALKTNLLAVNASIEAARAGEEGRGFAVVAEEVGQLATQSAAATKEIERIVEAIQLETGEVVEAMEVGTSQVVAGTRLVEETKQSLAQIVSVSAKIDELVASISDATVSQAQTSKSVTQLMGEIAQISERTSGSSRQVSNALQKTVEIAQKLQESVGTFKVA